MADSVLDLYAKLLLDDEEFMSGIKNAVGASEQASKKSGALGRALATAGKVGAAAITAATAAIGKFGYDSVKTGMDFDKSMSQVAATMGVTVDQIQNLRDFAMEMGAKTSFSAIQAADALNYMALAGYSAEESMTMLPTVLDLAAAGNMDLARASDMVTDAQTALGLTMENTTVMVDQMAKTASTTNTSVEQLGDAILTIGGTAQYMAGGTAELSQVLGLLADNGIKGSEAGTHLRNMLLKLASPTDDAVGLLNQFATTLGHDLVFDEATGQMRAFEDIFQDLNVAMDGFSDQDKIQAFSTLFNARDVAAANALLGTNAERWEEVATAIDGAQGSAHEMSVTQLNNLAGDITLFKSALEGAKIVISDQLTPTLRQFVSFGTTGIQQIIDGFKSGGLGGAMEAFGTVLSNALNMIIEMLPTLIDAGARLLSALVTGIIKNLPQIVSAAKTVIMNLVSGLRESMPQIMSSVADIITLIIETLIDLIPELAMIGVQISTAIAQGISDNIGSIIELAPVLLETGLQVLMTLIQGISDNIPLLMDTAVQIVTTLITMLTENGPMLIEMGMNILMAVVQGIMDNLDKIVESAMAMIEAIVDFLLGDGLLDMIEMGIKLILSLSNGLIKALPEIVKSLVQILDTLIQKILSNLPEFVSRGIDLIYALMEGLVDALPEIIQAVIDILTTLVGYIINHLPEFIAAGWEIIKSIAQAFIDNAPEAIQALWQLLTDLVTLIIDNLGEFFAQGLEILISMGKGIVEGTPEMLSKIGEAITGIWNAFTNTDWWSVGAEIISGIASGIWGAVSNLWEAAVQAAQTALSKIKNVLGIKSPSRVFRDQVGKMIPEGMAIGIEANTDKVEDAMDELANVAEPFDVSAYRDYNGASAEKALQGIVINIYPREGQDERTIADMVLEELNLRYEQEERAFA